MRTEELNEFVEHVREQTDIYSVVSRYVSLFARGGNFWGCCPFHNEKTPSFKVDNSKGLFYCFGCNVGGNVFKFLSLIENITYFEAVKLQAELLGIPLPIKKLSPLEEQQHLRNKALIEINERACRFYHNFLVNTCDGENARMYLQERGINKDIIEEFEIGWAPEKSNNFLRAFIKQGFSTEILEIAGLIGRSLKTNEYYDRFYGRIMFPVKDTFGHTVGFGGRILNDIKKDHPKYLNTSETKIFNKRQLLFGLNKSHRAINSQGFAIVVEGYMDMISLFGTGIENVVAILGTAFTTEHLKLLLRYTRKIIFCLDNDIAGQQATSKILPLFRDIDMEIFVVKLHDAKDPDEFIRKNGKEAFEKLLKTAVPFFDYQLNSILRDKILTTSFEKYKVLQEIFRNINKSKSRLEHFERIKKISAAILLEEDIIENEWLEFSSRSQSKEKFKLSVKSSASTNNSTVKMAGEIILSTIWRDNESLFYVIDKLDEVTRKILISTHQEILSWFEKCWRNSEKINDVNATEELSKEANEELVRILLAQRSESEFEEIATELKSEDIIAFDDSINFLQRVAIKKKLSGLITVNEKELMNLDPKYLEKKLLESDKLKKRLESLSKIRRD